MVIENTVIIIAYLADLFGERYNRAMEITRIATQKKNPNRVNLYAVLGVTKTMFFALLSPIAVYWLSRLVLKEKWHGKSIIASIVIGLMIAFLI